MTIKRLILAVLFLSSLAFGQAVRFGDGDPVQTTGTIPSSPGNWVKAVSTASINFCTAPANAVPCTNKATTYTSSTALTQCNTSTQVVRAGTTSCVATTDAFGNWGVWALAGQYEYTITINGASSGPYPVTIGGTGSGGGGTGIVSAGSTGQFAYYASDGTTVSPNANLLEGSGAFSYTGSIFSIG